MLVHADDGQHDKLSGPQRLAVKDRIGAHFAGQERYGREIAHRLVDEAVGERRVDLSAGDLVVDALLHFLICAQPVDHPKHRRHSGFNAGEQVHHELFDRRKTMDVARLLGEASHLRRCLRVCHQLRTEICNDRAGFVEGAVAFVVGWCDPGVILQAPQHLAHPVK